MSQQQYLKSIHQEIIALNKSIDSKIMRGETYKEESRRHKVLLKKMRDLQTTNFFSRVFSYSF